MSALWLFCEAKTSSYWALYLEVIFTPSKNSSRYSLNQIVCLNCQVDFVLIVWVQQSFVKRYIIIDCVDKRFIKLFLHAIGNSVMSPHGYRIFLVRSFGINKCCHGEMFAEHTNICKVVLQVLLRKSIFEYKTLCKFVHFHCLWVIDRENIFLRWFVSNYSYDVFYGYLSCHIRMSVGRGGCAWKVAVAI